MNRRAVFSNVVCMALMSVLFAAGGVDAQRAPKLKKNQILIESEPSGATVKMGSTGATGATPYIWSGKSRDRGNIAVTVSKGGYKSETKTLLYTGSAPIRESFALEKNEIVFTSDPSGATIEVNGERKGVTPFTWTNPPYIPMNIVVSKDGSKAGTKSVNYTGGKETVWHTLERNQIVFTSSPSGAAIEVGGKKIGATPFTWTDPPYNRDYSTDIYVTASMDSYAADNKKIVYTGGAASQSFTLEKNVITITSTPSNAVVEINGEQRGTTPFTWTAPAYGDMNIVVSMSGYNSARKTIRYNGGGVTEAFTLEKNEILITSDPSGATVTINGARKGTTPFTWTDNLPRGDIHIVVSRSGYATETKTIIYEGGVVSESFTLEKNEIVITSDPSDATVEVNGRRIGKTPLTWTPPSAGKLNFVVSKRGRISARQSVDYTGGAEEVSFRLERTSITAGQLIDDFYDLGGNRSRKGMRYNGKRVEVYGKITGVRRPVLGGDFYIALTSDDNKWAATRVAVYLENPSILPKLSVGQYITVVGDCCVDKGYFMDLTRAVVTEW